MRKQKPSFWAVIPANVRYDETLRPNAKLLYAEISAMTNKRGYCWASNEELGGYFGLASKTVSALVSQLAKCGYIDVEIRRDPATHEVTERRIRLVITCGELDDPPLENEGRGSPKNEDSPPLKNGAKNNLSSFNNPPKAPQGGRRSKLEPDWRPERFAGFWKIYPRGEAKQSAIRAWDRLKASDDLLDAMGKALVVQMASASWQEGIGIPYASTWLNQHRWEDEIFEPPEAPEQGGWAESEVL